MTKFAENDPERLKEFLLKLDELIEEYHPNIYLLDGVFIGVRKIEVAVLDELNKEK
jgi:Holliday junction resolvasome RuvABC endonuclease subunit